MPPISIKIPLMLKKPPSKPQLSRKTTTKKSPLIRHLIIKQFPPILSLISSGKTF